MVHQGSCVCGTVRYEVSGPFHTVMNCHCSMCRKHHGSAFGTYVSAPASGFRWLAGESAITAYASSENGRRYSCSVCGSVLPMLLAEHGLALCLAGPLEGSPSITIEAHIFAGSKAPWHTITDSLPQHEAYPPEFAAPAIPRPNIEPRPGVMQGSCLCGDVAYEATGEPLFMINCHCQRCRRARGAVYGTNVFHPEGQFRWTRGESQVVDYRLPEARFFGVAFCKRCGGAAPRVSRERGVAVIPAGTLDTAPPVRAKAHIFVGSKAPWFAITDSVPQYAEGPPPT